MIASGYRFGHRCGQSYGFYCPSEKRANSNVSADLRSEPKSDNCPSVVPHRQFRGPGIGRAGSAHIAKRAISHVYRFSVHAIH